MADSVEQNRASHYLFVTPGPVDEYWKKLRAWSLEEPGEVEQSIRLVDEHRSLVEKVTAKMIL